MSSANPPSIEAKLVVLGSQGIGKTSLVHRFVHHAFANPATMTSTIGASFVTKRVTDADSGTVVRLQIWDTAGQERFRSISKLYYRGANTAILCYDITSPSSFTELTHWLTELRTTLPSDTILHIVGTKADLVTDDPSRRMVPFESVVAFAAEHLYPLSVAGTQPVSTNPSFPTTPAAGAPNLAPSSVGETRSNRSSILFGSNTGTGPFWGQDLAWNSCHEVSASTGEGVEEVFRVITRRLVEQRNHRNAIEQRLMAAQMGTGSEGARTPAIESGGREYFYGDYSNGPYPGGATGGSFRLGHGDKRRSWLGIPQFPSAIEREQDTTDNPRAKRGPCCG